MTWKTYLRADPLPWLLEPDNPSVRYFTLTELLERSQEDSEVVVAREAIMRSEPVSKILAAQYPQGYWVNRGRGYSPKYKATVWQVIFLAELGATPTPQIEKGCHYVLQNSTLADGRFSAHKGPGGAVNCLNGNLLRALIRLGYGQHRAVQRALQKLAEVAVQEGFRCRFNALTPFPKRMDDGLPCAWGAIKVLAAFTQVPLDHRSSVMEKAISQGTDLLLSHDLTKADYPNASGVSPLWFKLGFPLGYSSDVLEALHVLSRLGLSDDPRLAPAVTFVLSKQDQEGRWTLEHTPQKMWARFETKGQPSKWVTLRALRVLKRLGG
ncbi:MAG: nitrogen fixation protein NifH [Anaerolineae bacterium]